MYKIAMGPRTLTFSKNNNTDDYSRQTVSDIQQLVTVAFGKHL
jgi:hypothetical protein